MKTQFTFGKYRCTYGVTNATYDYKIYPIGFVGGVIVATVSNSTATYCNTYASGSTFEKNGTTAITWSGGVYLKSIIGINPTARTGYSSSAKLNYSFSSTRQLCGQSAIRAVPQQRIRLL